MTPDSFARFHQAEDFFFRSLASASLDIASLATAHTTYIPENNLNPIYLRANTPSIQPVLEAAQTLFRGLPFVIFIPEHVHTQALQVSLNTEQLNLIETSRAMGLSLQNFESPTDARIQESPLSDWEKPLQGAFNCSADLAERYAQTHVHALKKGCNFQHYCLYLAKEPIACATLSINKPLARIDDVGTLPEYRGQGHATRLMLHALAVASKNGCTHAFLEASNAGFTLYQRLGFKTLFKYYRYS